MCRLFWFSYTHSEPINCIFSILKHSHYQRFEICGSPHLHCVKNGVEITADVNGSDTLRSWKIKDTQSTIPFSIIKLKKTKNTKKQWLNWSPLEKSQTTSNMRWFLRRSGNHHQEPGVGRGWMCAASRSVLHRSICPLSDPEFWVGDGNSAFGHLPVRSRRLWWRLRWSRWQLAVLEGPDLQMYRMHFTYLPCNRCKCSQVGGNICHYWDHFWLNQKSLDSQTVSEDIEDSNRMSLREKE